MKKVCASLFLIILCWRPLCQSAPLGRCGDACAAGGDFERTAGADAVAVLIVEPGKEPYVKEIASGLESLQHEVGGYIEAIYPYEDPVALVCNEEGKLEGLPLNRALRDKDSDIYSFLKLRNAAAAISEGGCVLSGSVH